MTDPAPPNRPNGSTKMTPTELFFYQNYSLDAAENIVPKPGFPRIGSWLSSKGYKIIAATYLGTRLKAREHRIKFLIKHGYVPKVLDHADGDITNNSLDNLRPATLSQNSANRRKMAGSSVYKGVWWHKKVGKWHAQYRRNGRMIHLGYFDDEVQAALTYDFAALDLHKEFALTNMVPNHYVKYTNYALEGIRETGAALKD